MYFILTKLFLDLLILYENSQSMPDDQENDSSSPNVNDKPRKVTFQDSVETVQTTTPPITSHHTTGGTAGRQLVPGLLLVHKEPSNNGFVKKSGPQVSPQTTATIAKELLSTGQSPTGETIAASASLANQSELKTSGESSPSTSSPTPSSGDSVGQKDKLMYLAQLLGFQVSSTYYNFVLI